MSWLSKSFTNNSVNKLLILRGMSSASANVGQGPIVKIPGVGAVQGDVKETPWSKRKFFQFLGIKYGESPSGERRFKVTTK